MIRLEHDVSSPHPYSRINSLGGTRGVFEDYPARIYLEPTNTNHQWDDFTKYAEWDHWLWKEHAIRRAATAGWTTSWCSA